jgi:hypothetical protein
MASTSPASTGVAGALAAAAGDRDPIRRRTVVAVLMRSNRNGQKVTLR